MAKSAILEFSNAHRPSVSQENHELRATIAGLRAELAESRELTARAHAAIAHDLNNVLTPILMSTALLDEQLTDAESRRLLAVLNESAQRGAAMVQQILTFGRSDRRPQVPTSPRRVLEDLRRLLAESFPHSIDIMVEVSSDVTDMQADPTSLHLVLVDLCVTARDAMPVGGLLTLRAEREQDCIAISVSHTGSGSASAPGTTSRILIPVVTATRDELVGDPPVYVRGNNELVLVVDDESTVRTLTEQMLRAYGYRVVTASNGAEAVAEFARHLGQISVVLTDIMMPVMDGTHTMRALRTIDPRVKLIAVTALDAGAAIDYADGVAAVVVKPFRVDTLLRTLRRVLDE